MTENFYTILGVTRDASEEDIKRSYRRLALKYHPDRNAPGDKFAENRFREILDAYNVLSDKNRRTIYDYDLAKGIPKAASRTASKRPAETKASPPPPPAPVTQQSILADLLKIRKQVEKVDGKVSINQKEFYRALNTALSLRNIDILRGSGDNKVANMAIDELLVCLKMLSVEYLDKITIKLIKLAGTDNEKILEIHNFNKKRKQAATIQKYIPYIAISAIVILMFLLINLL
jgi:curved DNA-binding protein CbpA